MNDLDLIDDNLAGENSEFGITEQAKGFLLETSKWGKFLAIVGFVFVGLIVIGALTAIIFTSQLGTGVSAGQMVGMIIGYLLVGLLYLFPCIYLFNFSKKTKLAINSLSSAEMQNAFENLKSMFKFMGIFMIIILSIYGLMILVGGLGFLTRF